MPRTAKYGLIYVCLCAALQVLVFAAIFFGREYEIKTYPRYLLPAVCILPIFSASWFINALIKERASPFTMKEMLVFAGIVIVGVFAVSVLLEAHFLYTAMGASMDLTFTDILFAPLNERFTVGVLFGFGFATSATLVAAYFALIRIPATLRVRTSRPPAGP